MSFLSSLNEVSFTVTLYQKMFISARILQYGVRQVSGRTFTVRLRCSRCSLILGWTDSKIYPSPSPHRQTLRSQRLPLADLPAPRSRRDHGGGYRQHQDQDPPCTGECRSSLISAIQFVQLEARDIKSKTLLVSKIFHEPKLWTLCLFDGRSG